MGIIYRSKGGYFLLWKPVLFTLIFGFIGILAMIISKTWGMFSLGLIIAFGFYGYLLYLRKKITQGSADIEISVDDDGLHYNGISLRLFQIRNMKAIVPYETIMKVEIENVSTGPVKIETLTDKYFFWDHLDVSANIKLVDEIKYRIQRLGRNNPGGRE